MMMSRIAYPLLCCLSLISDQRLITVWLGACGAAPAPTHLLGGPPSPRPHWRAGVSRTAHYKGESPRRRRLANSHSALKVRAHICYYVAENILLKARQTDE